ncbi:MAG: DUF3343 domain-containing protein [Fusobacteriaceae bacterium]
MITEFFILLAADSTSQVIQSEVLLKDGEVPCRVIPLPSEIKASCGLSIKLQKEDLERALDILKAKNIHMEIYEVEKKGLKKKIDFLTSF